MMNDDGKQGSRKGNTRSERMERARAGAFRGKQYEHDGVCAPGYGKPKPTLAGSGRTFVSKQPINTPKSTHDPYKQQTKVRPGSGL